MNLRNVTGAVVCAAILGSMFLASDGAWAFVDVGALLIVLSGTFGAILLSYPWERIRAAVQVGWNSYVVRPPHPDEIVRSLIAISVRSRFDGLLSLERFENQTTVTFLRRALEMVVDGYRADEVRQILRNEILQFCERRTAHERVFRHTARLAPAFGVAGSVVGLMGMLFGIGETAIILRTIPLALTSTLYGILLANFLLIPVAENIHAKTRGERLVKQLVLDGVCAVLAEQNPRKLERRLESFLTPAARSERPRTLEEIRRRYAELETNQPSAAEVSAAEASSNA